MINPEHDFNFRFVPSGNETEWTFRDANGNELELTGSLYSYSASNSSILPITVMNDAETMSFVIAGEQILEAPAMSIEVIDSVSVDVMVNEIANASGYTLQYSANPDFTDAQSLSVEPGVRSISGLNADTTYYFRVLANGSGVYVDSSNSVVQLATTPSFELVDGYNSIDYTRLSSFLEQTDVYGQKNGFKINLEYDSENPETWTGVVWTETEDGKRIASINWTGLCLYGRADFSDCKYLTELAITGIDSENSGELLSLNVSGCAQLSRLNLSYNQLENLDLTSNLALTELDCTGNLLTALDVTQNTELTNLSVSYNQLTSLDVSHNVNLQVLQCCNNSIETLDLKYNTKLTELICWNSTLQEVKMNITAIDKARISLCDADNTSWTFKNSAQQVLVETTTSSNPYFTISELPVYATNQEGTQTILLSTSEVNAMVVLRDSLTTNDIAAELPTGISTIRAGKTVYAEIWVKDVENTDPAIVGGYLNMLYDNAALTVQDVTYCTVFNSLTGYQTFEDGKISTIGGVTTAGVLDQGDDEWVRLATVSFVAETEGSTEITLAAPENNIYNLTRTDALTLSNDQIYYGSANLDITAACPMDVDGDGYIAISDYALLSNSWLSSPGFPNWNPACDFDGDGYVAMSDYAILSRNWLKSVNDPDLYFPVVNSSPAAAVCSEIIVSPYNQIAYTDNAVVDVRLAAVSTKTASDSAADVPASLEQVAPGDSFFVEIWVRNKNGYENSTLCGLTGGYVNMGYNSELLSVDSVTYGSIFSQLNGFQNTSTPGYIDTIGGAVSPGVMNMGDDEWVRLATVAFTATGEGDAAIESLAPAITQYNLTLTSGKTLKNDEIDFGALTLTIGSQIVQLQTPTLTVSATDAHSVSVTLGSVSNASGYSVEYSTSDDFANAESLTVSAGATSITGLSANTTYYFRALAVGSENYSNSEYSGTAIATTMAEPVILEPVVNARVVFRDSLTNVDTSAELPEGISSIQTTQTVYAEIWVKDIDDADPAIVGGYLNMLYDNDALTVLDVAYGTVFNQMTGLQQYEQGKVSTVGGFAANGVIDKGDDEWVRLATVSFVANTEGSTTVSLDAPRYSQFNLTRTGEDALSNEQINFGSAELEITATIDIQLTAQNDFVKTTLNTPVVIDYRENDAVSDWTETTVQFGNASYGEYTVNDNGTIVYTPNEGFYGTDAVSYVVVGSSGELATGAIVIEVALPIATSVQTTSGSHSPSTSMAPSVPSLTDWDDCCIELWAQGVNELNPGETTITMEYNPAVYNAPTFSASAEGVALSVSQSTILPNGNVQVELTAHVSEPIASQTDNLFLGTVVLTPSMEEGSGVEGSAVPAIVLDGAETPTTVESMQFDLKRNGAVDVNDFIAFATVFGYDTSNISPDSQLYSQVAKADFNADGVVNVEDFIMFAINFGVTKNPSVNPTAQGASQVKSEAIENEVVGIVESGNVEVIDSQDESPVSPLDTHSSQLVNENPVESSMTLRQAHSSALLDLYDNQNEPEVSVELTAPAVDEAFYQDDEFDFLFDDSDLDSDDSSNSDVDLSVVLDELEL